MAAETASVAREVDGRLGAWIERVAGRWQTTAEQAALALAVGGEARNRRDVYGPLGALLRRPPLEWRGFSELVQKSWALGHRHNATRLSRFLVAGPPAQWALTALLDDFPAAPSAAAVRIDEFVDAAVDLGYRNSRGGQDRAGAALLASVLLTSVYPDRFVDGRRAQWATFASRLAVPFADTGSSYGALLNETGACARTIARTATFRRLWWSDDTALWLVAALCWIGQEPGAPPHDPMDLDALTFPEGGTKRRLHLLHERSAAVIAAAKALALKKDPLLSCEVCRFSFVRRYGERGRDFIEGHHKQPVATLRPGSRTSIADIALVCSNCHRMLHQGERSASVEDLRAALRPAGDPP